jgi:hypothetical protein
MMMFPHASSAIVGPSIDAGIVRKCQATVIMGDGFYTASRDAY